MKNDLFDSEEKINKAISAFTNLLNNEGWKLLEQIWDENIELLRQQLENGSGENETKSDIDRVRDKLTLLREIKNTPSSIIKKLESPEDEIPATDPFETADELRAKRKEAQVQEEAKEEVA